MCVCVCVCVCVGGGGGGVIRNLSIFVIHESRASRRFYFDADMCFPENLNVKTGFVKDMTTNLFMIYWLLNT